MPLSRTENLQVTINGLDESAANLGVRLGDIATQSKDSPAFVSINNGRIGLNGCGDTISVNVVDLKTPDETAILASFVLLAVRGNANSTWGSTMSTH